MNAENSTANAKAIYVILPWEREIIEAVILAACSYFEITREDLLTQSKTDFSQIRFLCFFIIASNTSLSPKKIGYAFKRGRDAVNYGVDIIESHRRIFPQTLRNINAVIDIANNFEKKQEWHLPRINTTS